MTITFTDTANSAAGNAPGPVLSAVIGGFTYLFVANGTSSTVRTFRVGDDGTLTTVGSPVAAPGGPSSMTLSTNAGLTYLHVTEFVNSTMSTFVVGNGGSLTNIAGSPLNLGFKPNAVTSVVVGGVTYIYAGGDLADVITGYKFGPGNSLITTGVSSSASATALTSAVVDGVTFLFSAGRDNDTIRVFWVNTDGTLSAMPTVVTDNATLMLDGVGSLTSAVIGGNTFLFAGSVFDDGISVFQVGVGGTLTNVHNITDSQSPLFELDTLASLTTQVINGVTYLFAAGQADDGVSVFTVSAGGILTNVGNIFDQAGLKLDGATGVATAVVGGANYMFVTGMDDNGVSAFRLSDNAWDNVYLVTSPTDIVDETGGAGTDLVLSTINFSLADPVYVLGDVENLTLLGTALIGTGNGLINVITGNDGDNILDGGGAKDTLAGGLGDDSYIVDASLDTVIEAANAGTDTVFFFGTAGQRLVLAAEVENLVLLAGAVTGGIGNGLANTITGNALSNVLDGGANTDTLIGDKGNDTYYVDRSLDLVIESYAAGGGTDTVRFTGIKGQTYVLPTNVENLVLFGTASGGTGNALRNTITGNNSANTLNGGTGNDILDGRAGNDKLLGGTGDDEIEGGHGRDIMTGGSGRDDFNFDSVRDMGKTARTRDIITDFKHRQDDIDLRTIDANGTAAGNGRFHFVAREGDHFTHHRGELIYDKINHAGVAKDMTIISGDTNGDGRADFMIQLTGLKTLTASDFFL